MVKKSLWVAAALALSACAQPAFAQVPLQVVVSSGVQDPAGFFEINGEVWVGDSVNGLLHLAPSDRSNPNPLDTGTYVADLTAGWTISGSAQFPLTNMGQLFQVNDTLALVTVRNNAKGADNNPIGGAYAVQFAPQNTFPISPVGNFTHLVPNKGLNGPVATSIAPGPDGKQYVGFQKNGNEVRINGANVENVGGLGGRSISSQVFVGSDVYLGAADGFYVLRNAPACSGNQNNCGVPTLIQGGATTAVASDGLGHVYFVQAVGTLSRYTVADGTIVQVTSGLSVDPITGSLGFDHHQNLWVGGITTMSRILASDLAQLP